MKIVKSPTESDLFRICDMKKVMLYTSTFKAVDDKGRYLSWEEFKRRNTKDTEEKWLATKLSRRSLFHKIKLHDLTFYFGVPDTLQGHLHFIDKNAAGNIGTSSVNGVTKSEQNTFLLKSLIIEEAITSAQLEGAATTRKVAKEMLKTARQPRTKDEMMILNNYRLMQEVTQLVHNPLSIELILKLHRIATNHAIDNEATPGEFRQNDEIYIGDEYGNNIHQPPSHLSLQELMQAVCDFANQENDGENEENNFIHPVIKAMIIHFLIGYIHPFGDGNGRTARALFYYYMLKQGYWLFEYVSISRLLKEAPVQYAKAYINVEQDGLDMTYFLYYQVNIIKRAIKDLYNYIERKQQKFHAFAGKIAQFIEKCPDKLNTRQIKILQKAVKNSGYIFTIKESCNEFNITENTARKDFKLLAQLGLLVEFKENKGTNYISPSDLLTRLENFNP